MRTHTTPSSIPGFEDPYSKLRLVSPILPKSLADPSISQPAKRTSAMQQGGGSIQRNGSGNSTSQRVQPSLSETLYDIIPSDEEHANHQQSSSQCRNTGSNGYTPVQSRPVLLHHYQQHSNGTQGWQAIPRLWPQASPDVRHSTRHPTLDRYTMVHLSSQSVSLYGYSTWATSNRLTLAELDRLNGQHARTDTQDRWKSESQRDGSWDGIGYVRSLETRSQTNGW